jgi:hypothetical protein
MAFALVFDCGPADMVTDAGLRFDLQRVQKSRAEAPGPDGKPLAETTCTVDFTD